MHKTRMPTSIRDDKDGDGFEYDACYQIHVDAVTGPTTPTIPRSPRSRAIADPAQPQITSPRSRTTPSCATPYCDRCNAEHYPGQRAAARHRCDSWGGAYSAGHQGNRQDGAAAMECAVARRVLVHGSRASLCGCGSSTAARWPFLSSRSHGVAPVQFVPLLTAWAAASTCEAVRWMQTPPAPRVTVSTLRHSKGSLWVGRRSGACNCPGICSGRVQCRWRELGCT